MEMSYEGRRPGLKAWRPGFGLPGRLTGVVERAWKHLHGFQAWRP